MISHILNGDALQEIFPLEIEGKQFISRECLCDGEVLGKTLDEFFENRAVFISNSFSGFSKDDYYSESVAEYERIQSIPASSDINLWFEEDVFCQVNFWFVVDLLYHRFEDSSFSLVLPKKGCEYSFANMEESDLEEAYENKMDLNLDELKQLSNLWVYYKSANYDSLLSLAKRLGKKFSFILKAVEAIIEDKNNNKVEESLKAIIVDLDTKDFVEVFKEFHRREAIYGYGDLQVKRIFEKLI